MLLFFERFAINSIGIESLCSFAYLLHPFDWRFAASCRWTREAVIRSAQTISWSWTCRVPTSVGEPVRRIYCVALIGMNVSAPPLLAFTWNMKILLRPAVWITTLDAETPSSTQYRTTETLTETHRTNRMIL